MKCCIIPRRRRFPMITRKRGTKVDGRSWNNSSGTLTTGSLLAGIHSHGVLYTVIITPRYYKMFFFKLHDSVINLPIGIARVTYCVWLIIAGRLILFYTAFYGCVLFFFGACLGMFSLTLDEITPVVRNGEPPLQLNPGNYHNYRSYIFCILYFYCYNSNPSPSRSFKAVG